jgi:hypothetical protein
VAQNLILFVMPGLDPGIHVEVTTGRNEDTRIKSAYGGSRFDFETKYDN